MNNEELNPNEEGSDFSQDSDKILKYSELSRREIRSLIFHLLYMYDAYEYQTSLESIVDNLNRGLELDIPLDSEVVKLTEQIANDRNGLDNIVIKFLANWRLERLSVATRIILRIGVWELLNTDIPSTVVINEAVELAKCFAEIDAYKFINGILDEVAKKIPEMKRES